MCQRRSPVWATRNRDRETDREREREGGRELNQSINRDANIKAFNINEETYIIGRQSTF